MKKQMTRALTLEERIGIIKNKNYINSSIDTNDILEAWRNRNNILSDAQFDSLLDCLGISKIEFSLAIKNINSTVDTEQVLKSSKWYNQFKQSLDLTDDVDDKDYSQSINICYFFRNFSNFVEKNIKVKLAYINLTTSLLNSIMSEFSQSSVVILHKCFIQELNNARENRILQCKSSEERFHEYCRLSLKKENLIEFYCKYPVLARLLTNHSNNFINNITEFFQRYNNHKAQIHEQFKITCNSQITMIKVGKGDTHQKGHTVYEITFEDGHELMYKPKELEIIDTYNEIINWLNTKKITPMKTVEGLYYNDYAFEKKVVAKHCKHKSEVNDFYKGFGQLLALMHILQANDMHMENIIASGKYPIIIDLETILQQSMLSTVLDNNTAEQYLMNKLSKSVISIGLLPEKMTSLNIDLSGLAGDETELNVKVEGVVNTGTDIMHIEEGQAFLKEANNIVKLNNSKANYKEYTKYILAGFERVYDVIYQNKEEFIEKFIKFSNKKVRVLIRNTQNYVRMLELSYHPSSMTDWLDRENIMQNLFNHLINKPAIHYCEYKDMLFGDIPIFYNNINSENLLNSEGKVITKYFKNSSYENIKNAIAGLTLDEINTQKNIVSIKISDYITILNSNRISFDNVGVFLKSNELPDQSLLDESRRIADMIIENATIINETCSFLTFPLTPHPSIDVIDNSLYSGLTGMGLLFLYLYNVTKTQKYKEFLEVIVRSIENSENKNSDSTILTGNNSKLVLYNYILQSFGENGDIISKIDKVLDEISNTTEAYTKYDWVGGICSIIHTICNIFETIANPNYITLILKLENQMSNIIAENTDILGGFSHGYSSIASVYFKMATLLDDKKFALKGFTFIEKDNNYYDETLQGWIDKRTSTNDCLTHWCHGAVGIAGSRIQISDYLNDKDIFDKDIKIAEELVRRTPTINDDTLCHGNLGKSELFIMLAKYDVKYLEQARNYAKNIISLRKTKYYYNNLGKIQDYSFFTGISGIAYQLLRIYDPESVPSILFLE